MSSNLKSTGLVSDSGAPQQSSGNDNDLVGAADLHDVIRRLLVGLTPTLGFTALGFIFGALIFLVASPVASTTTSMRVTFGFAGYGKGEYPDHSKFDPDDLRAPDIIVGAIKRQSLEATDELQWRIRSGLTVEGLIPPNVIKERDRLRAAGQTPAPYLPDEYLVTLSLRRSVPLDNRQRELLLNEIVSEYREKFQRTYADIPLAFGNAFDSLKVADFYEYELILDNDFQNIRSFLEQQLDQAKNFRSSTTNLSFSDLIAQAELFSQINLFETLGFIRENGLSRNRSVALVKMDYFLRSLEDQEQKAIAEEKVVLDLLTREENHSANYVLGIKSQATQQRPEVPMLDQGLIDSLLANDSTNFLVRHALTAGLKVKSIQAKKAQLLGRRKDMESFLNRNSQDQSALFEQVQKSLKNLESAYNLLISDIRKTHSDFARQQYADAIRISMQPLTTNRYKQLAESAAVGGTVGLVFGMGLSLLGIFVGSKKST